MRVNDRKMTREEKSPTLLRRFENFGRTGGVFGMVFAHKNEPQRTQRTPRIIKIFIFGRTRLGGEFTLILATEDSEILGPQIPMESGQVSRN